MAMDPSMRAGDSDRELVADRLREAHAEGRLTVDELHERLDRTYSARTLGELTPVTADLPANPQQRRPTVPTAAPGHRTDRGLRAMWAAWAAAVLINVVVWLIVVITNGELIYFWPAWVAGPWGAVLLAGTIFGRGDKGGPR
jgi:hypothetical protein